MTETRGDVPSRWWLVPSPVGLGGMIVVALLFVVAQGFKVHIGPPGWGDFHTGWPAIAHYQVEPRHWPAPSTEEPTPAPTPAKFLSSLYAGALNAGVFLSLFVLVYLIDRLFHHPHRRALAYAALLCPVVALVCRLAAREHNRLVLNELELFTSFCPWFWP